MNWTTRPVPYTISHERMEHDRSEHSVLLVDTTDEGPGLANALESAGCAVEVVDLARAQELTPSALPELLVLGLEEPESISLCDAVRELPRGGAVAIILMAGAGATVRSTAEAILRGADTLLSRPVGTDDLLRKASNLIGPFPDLPSIPPSPAPTSPPDEPRESTIPSAPRAQGLTREPTAILDDPTGPILAGQLPPEGEAEATDIFAREAMLAGDTGLQEDTGPIDEEQLFERSITPARPERTQVLRSDEDRDTAPGDSSLLSAEFRQVIDRVAQRLFPEAGPDDYDDEAFDELKTVVPVLGDPLSTFDDEFDEYSLEAMETYPGSDSGLTLSLFDGLTMTRGEDRTEEDNHGDVTPTETRREGASPSSYAPGPAAPTPPPSGPALSTSPDTPPQGSPVSPVLSARKSEPPTTGSEEERPGPAVIRVGEVTLSRGELRELSVPILLAASISGQVTGRLVVRQEGRLSEEAPWRRPGERVIVLQRGQAVSAASTLASDRLLEMLRLQGRLTAAQYDRCRSLVQNTGRRPGAVLVDQRIINPGELIPLVRWHYAEILFASFGWRRGTFRLEPLSPRYVPRITIDRPLEELLFEGIRRRYGAEELATLLGGAEVRLEAHGGVPIPGLAPDEEHLVPLCDGSRTLSQVVSSSGLEGSQALAALYGLLLLERLMPETGTAGAPAMATMTVQDRCEERTRLEERISQCHEADYFSLLGIPIDATAYEVRLAYERSVAELAPDRLAALDATDLDDQLEDLRYVLEEARELLSDDALRESYREHRFS